MHNSLVFRPSGYKKFHSLEQELSPFGRSKYVLAPSMGNCPLGVHDNGQLPLTHVNWP